MSHSHMSARALDVLKGLHLRGQCDEGMTGSTTTIVSSALAGHGNDFFNSGYVMLVLLDADDVGDAPEGEYRDITDYVSDTGTFTTQAFSANVEEFDWILILRTELMQAFIAQGMFYRGRCDVGMTGSTTTIVSADLAGYADDIFNTDYVMVVLLDANDKGDAPEGEIRDITDYVSATGTFTTVAFSANVEENDLVLVARREYFIIDGVALQTILATGSFADTIMNKDGNQTFNRETDSLEAIRDLIAGFDPSWVAMQLLIDADDFDVLDADANTERWTPEYITGVNEADASINDDTSDKLYMKIDSSGAGAREYAVARELPIGLRHFSVYADADFTWGTVTATAMRGGIMISRGAAYDANNYIRVYKEKSSGVERIRCSYNFGGGGDTEVPILDTSDDEISFKIDRINTVFRIYYSLTQSGDAVWVLGAQIEDTADNIDDNPSFYFNIYSVGSAASEDIQVDFGTWRLGNTFGAFVDTIVSGYDSTDVAANLDGAVMERLESVLIGLGAVIAGGAGYEEDGSGVNLYESVVGVSEAGWMDGTAQQSLSDMPHIQGLIHFMTSPQVGQDSIPVARLSLHNLRTDSGLVTSAEYSGATIHIERYRIGTDSAYTAIVNGQAMTEIDGGPQYSYTFPAASWQDGDLLRYAIFGAIVEMPAGSGQTFYIPRLEGHGVVGGISAVMKKLTLLQDTFLMADWDRFDVTASGAPMSTQRWEEETYVDNAEGSDADIHNTTSGKAYVYANPTSPLATGVWIRQKPRRFSRHYTVIVDAAFTWGTEGAGDLIGGLMVTEGQAYDANNHVQIVRRQSTTGPEDDILADATFGSAAQSQAEVNITDSALAFRIDRIGNIWRAYYSLTPAPNYEWTLITQFEDTAGAIGSVTSIALFAHSPGVANDETVIVDFDNFKYYNHFGFLADILTSDEFESSGVIYDIDGSFMERIESLLQGLGVSASASGGEIEEDGSPDLPDIHGVPKHFTASASTANTLTDTDLVDKAIYVGQIVVPLQGDMAGQGRYITAYDGNDVITVLPAWPEAPGTVHFIIMPSNLGRILLALGAEYTTSLDVFDTIVTGYTTAVTATAVGAVLERIQLLQDAGVLANTIWETDGATVNTITCAELADTADQYVGQMFVPIEDAEAGQARMITAYDGTSVLTVVPDWQTDPDTSGDIKFVIVPSDTYFLYVAGKGLEAIFDIVDAIPDLTRVGGTHDQSDAAGTEDTVWTIDAPAGNWSPNKFVIDLTELVALDQVRIRIKYRIESGGNMIVEVDDTFVGVPVIPLKTYDLHVNRFGMIITTAQTAGTARDWVWEIYYEG